MTNETIIEFSPVANIFPLMQPAEFADLVKDIKENGLIEPIWTFEGKIIDGRNRYNACKELGKTPLFRVYDGEESNLVPFVVSLNLKRRHLNESQRAVVAAKIANMKEGGQTAAQICAVSQTEAADQLNVSRRSVQSAKKVLNEGVEELVEAVEAGEIPVSSAEKIAQLPKEEQRDFIGNQRTLGTGENEWYTPEEYIEMAREVLGGIDLDPASCEQANKIVKAKTYYTKEDNGLEKEWEGRVFMNPPYSKDLMPKFVEKIISEKIHSGIVLTHNNTDTKWFHSLSCKASAICFTKGRISFYRDNIGASPTNGQAFFYIGKDVDSFSRVFREIGIVMVPYAP